MNDITLLREGNHTELLPPQRRKVRIAFSEERLKALQLILFYKNAFVEFV